MSMSDEQALRCLRRWQREKPQFHSWTIEYVPGVPGELPATYEVRLYEGNDMHDMLFYSGTTLSKAVAGAIPRGPTT